MHKAERTCTSVYAAQRVAMKLRPGVQGDMSKLGDLDRLFAQIGRDKGRLDILFANAGTAKYAPLGSITEELYNSIFASRACCSART